GVVIFAGSFSDVLFPALRLGYLVVPRDMVDIFAAAESVSSHQPASIDQAILCDFINEGHFARHVRRMRELYAERLSILLESARERWAGRLGRYAYGRSKREGLVLGFAAFDERELRRGVEQLARALEGVGG